MSIANPIPEIKLFQTLTLKLQGQGHWCGQRAKSYNQYPINSLHFHLTSIRPTIPEIQLFQNFTLKHPRSRSWVRSKVKVTCYTQYPTVHLLFVSNQSDQPFLRYGQNSVWLWKKKNLKFLRKICQNNSFQWNFCHIKSGTHHDLGNNDTYQVL